MDSCSSQTKLIFKSKLLMIFTIFDYIIKYIFCNLKDKVLAKMAAITISGQVHPPELRVRHAHVRGGAECIYIFIWVHLREFSCALETCILI